MRTRVIVVALVGSLLASPLVAEARPPTQEESGTVLFPTPHPQDLTICFQGVGRRIHMLSQGVVNGPFGHTFEIDEKTWGGKFTLEVVSGVTGAEDLDLYYFKSFGDSIPDDPILNSPIILQTYQERGPGGEKGKVPAESTLAIACLYDGLGAGFEYEADPPKAKKGKKGKKKKK